MVLVAKRFQAYWKDLKFNRGSAWIIEGRKQSRACGYRRAIVIGLMMFLMSLIEAFAHGFVVVFAAVFFLVVIIYAFYDQLVAWGIVSWLGSGFY